jgi:hypothetical protein
VHTKHQESIADQTPPMHFPPTPAKLETNKTQQTNLTILEKETLSFLTPPLIMFIPSYPKVTD